LSRKKLKFFEKSTDSAPACPYGSVGTGRQGLRRFVRKTFIGTVNGSAELTEDSAQPTLVGHTSLPDGRQVLPWSAPL